MNDADYKKLRNKIRKMFHKWQQPMGMRMFEVNLTWDRSYHPKGYAATTEMSRWLYHSYDITFYMPTLAEMDDEHLENVVIHELTHCLLAPLSSNLKYDEEGHMSDTMEWNTELVARAVEWIYRAGADSVKLNHKEKKQ